GQRWWRFSSVGGGALSPPRPPASSRSPLDSEPRRHPPRRSDDRRTRRGLPSVFWPPSVTTSVDVEAPIGTGMMAENHRSTCRLQRPGDYPALLERYFPCGPVAANQPDKHVDQTTN